MSWANAYVGLPWADKGRFRDGVDCWGLVTIVYQDELGLTLPSYVGAYASAEEAREVAGLFENGAATATWRKAVAVRPYDLLLFRRGRYAAHVGIALDRQMMLHVEANGQACIVNANDPRWANRRIGIYRHFTQASKGVL